MLLPAVLLSPLFMAQLGKVCATGSFLKNKIITK
jgi:hypothetical protein